MGRSLQRVAVFGAVGLVAGAGLVMAPAEAASNTIVKRAIPVPDGIAASSDGSKVWIVSDVKGGIYRLAGGKLTGPQNTTTGTAQHIDAWTAANGRRGYFLDEDEGTVSSVRWAGKHITRITGLGSQTTALTGGTANGKQLLFVLNVIPSGGSVTVINRTTSKVTGTWNLPSADSTEPQAFALSPAGRTLYVGNYSGQDASIWAISTKTGKVTRTLSPNYPGQQGAPLEIGSLAVGPNGKYLYAGVPTGGGSAGTYKLNAQTGKILAKNYVNSQYTFVQVALAGTRVVSLASNPFLNVPGPGSLQVLRQINLRQVGRSTTTPSPTDLEAAAKGGLGKAYISGGNDDTVWTVRFGAGTPVGRGTG